MVFLSLKCEGLKSKRARRFSIETRRFLRAGRGWGIRPGTAQIPYGKKIFEVKETKRTARFTQFTVFKIWGRGKKTS